MKRNIFGLVAVVMAIALSSFSTKTGTFYYLMWKGGSFVHNSINSYTPQTATPDEEIGTSVLYFVGVEDINGTAGIQAAEFNAAFAVLDVNTVDNNLGNESERSTTYTIVNVGTGAAQLELK